MRETETPAPVEAPSPTTVIEPTEDPAQAQARALARLAEKAVVALPKPRTPKPRSEPVLGGDISWPQCPTGLGIPERRTLGLPMPLPQAEFVIVGLTNGPGFTANPCLGDQVAWVAERKLMSAAYAVVSQPSAAQIKKYGADGPYDASTTLGQLANTGYQQSLINIAGLRRAGLNTPMIWVDVEPVPDFDWSSDAVANAAVVEGAIQAYDVLGYRVGVYSTPALWSGIVGDLTLGLPEWRAAGQTSRAEAQSRCGADWSIQGGPAVLGQWVEADRDQNVTCPGQQRRLGQWFHQN